MIYPTQRAVVLAALGAPAGLVVGVVSPGGWAFAALWVALMVLMTLVDAMLVPRLRADPTVMMPGVVGVGERFDLRPAIAGAAAPATPEFAVDLGAPALADTPAGAGGGFVYRAARRGSAPLRAVWARRAGPLGLAWRQRRVAGTGAVTIVPDLRPVRDQGMRQYLRAQSHGSRLRPDAGDGNEFQALTDFQTGMPRRAIDWKSSARHRALLAREYRTERSNSLVFAIDSGRSMSDPVGDVPRIDRAVSAALLSAFVALKGGDQVRLFSFAARPRIDTGMVGGGRSFARLHQAASEIDYTTEESNYTLSLVTLDQRLQRRSTVILFTEFADPTGAELMIAAARRLLRRHQLLLVLFEDVELEEIAARRPERADDVTRANIAHSLLRERRIVVERLKRHGIDVIESPPDALPLDLVDHYLRIRQQA